VRCQSKINRNRNPENSKPIVEIPATSREENKSVQKNLDKSIVMCGAEDVVLSCNLVRIFCTNKTNENINITERAILGKKAAPGSPGITGGSHVVVI
jgi:hypothetical protein